MSKPNRSENFRLFDCTLDILNNEVIAQNYKTSLYFVDRFYADKGVETYHNFSHDNFIGIYCFFKKFDPEYISQLPLLDHFNWSTHHSKRPDNFLFFLWAKYPLLGIWFLWIPSIAMIIGSLRVWRTNSQGVKTISTSGKILTFLRTNTFNMPITKFICDYIINNHKDLKGYDKVFEIYHKVERPHIYEAFKKWGKNE